MDLHLCPMDSEGSAGPLNSLRRKEEMGAVDAPDRKTVFKQKKSSSTRLAYCFCTNMMRKKLHC